MSTSTFVTLPNELLLEIARSFDERGDLHALTLVSKQCYGVADPVLWQREACLDRPGPLHWAIEGGNISLLKKALDLGGNPNQPAYGRWPKLRADNTRWWDYTPAASSTRNLDLHSHSHSHDSADSSWSEFGRACWRPIHLAVTKGRTDMVELLLDRGAAIDSLSWRLCDCQPHPSIGLFPNLTPQNDGWGLGFLDIMDGGWTPLHLAICHKDVEMAKLLLRHGASTDIHQDTRWNRNASSEPSTPRNITAMHEAARHGLLDLMVFLMEEGYQSVDKDSDLVGKPIHLAIWNRHFDAVVPWLKEQGASLDEVCQPEIGMTPLLAMCKTHQLDSIVRLIELGADVCSHVGTETGFAALHFLAYAPEDDLANLGGNQNITKSEVVKLLVSKGLDVDTPERDSGYSALIVASAYCDIDMMRTLLECGANPNYRDHGGCTAFNKIGYNTESPEPRVYEAGQMLSDWGLDIQGPFSENQTTPLNSVCLSRTRTRTNPFRERQILRLARLLLNRGADPNETGRLRTRPVFQAMYSGAFDVASLLLENGGRPQWNDLETLLTPMAFKANYQPGLVSYVLQLDYEKYDILKPSNLFLDELLKRSFFQDAWQAAAELVEHHRSSALPPNALHRVLDKATPESNTANNVQLPLPLVRALLKNGADPNVTWKGETALYYAGRAADFAECIGELIAAGADVNKTTPKMPEGVLLFLFKNSLHDALGHIFDHDDRILRNRPREFHSKCWEYLFRPEANQGTNTQSNTDSPPSEIDLDDEEYDIIPIAWDSIYKYIRRGLRTDVDLEDGDTLQDTVRKVVARCTFTNFYERNRVIEHLGLSPDEPGLLDNTNDYERHKRQVSLQNELQNEGPLP
ncbi:unnamed protein product [Clonostachys rosea]|uniref:F-box domain-containing protein n=1 Tax=Bionectria ochroleuca TaxID=29856 RepID=A0ABY6TVN5_BIOOC|nr:unnamed protein product [Clonostachys rosea]